MLLTACGSGADPATSASAGAAPPPVAPSAIAPSAAPSLGPGKYTGEGEIKPPTLPAPRGQALRVSNKYTYQVQVLDAQTTASVPGVPPPAGTTALAVLLRVEADPPGRRIMAPVQRLSITYPSCRRDQNQDIACTLEHGTPYRTEDEMLYGGREVRGIDPVFGVLAANTVYYTWAWQLISEKADLTGAALCETGEDDSCIPIGAIRADS
ncbi:hypothetical protein DMB66_37465 [Actinoplanes sp. ATCC 53533]|nr:hypothetical protein DMB66_37465 [Actinoplanes sp. ATCC 53533]